MNTENEVRDFRNLPAGTRLRIHTAIGGIVDIEVVGPVSTNRYGPALEVKLLSDQRSYYQHPDAIAMQASALSQLGRPCAGTADYMLARVDNLEPGVDLIFDDFSTDPRPSKIAAIELIAA